MEKKNVQISSTTLGLRFMQNAKIQQEQRQTEVAQVKIQNEEQWHLEASEEQGESSKHTDDNTKRSVLLLTSPYSIVYESSYLPFLFPDSQSNAEEEDNQLRFKGRRAFGKYGKEKEIIAPAPLPEPNVLEESNETQSEDTVSTSARSPLSKSRPTHKRSTEPRADPPSRSKDGLRAFLRPNVEAPKTSKRIFDHTSEPARKRKKKAADPLTEHP